MNLNFITVLINILVLILLGAPGYFFRKIKMLGEKDSKPLVVLLIYITQPFLIIMSFQGKKYTPDILMPMFWVFLFSLLIHVFILLAAKPLFNRFNISRDKKGVYTFASAFSNCGYMGIPVINALFRGSAGLSEMLIYVSVYIAVFNIVNWTVGIYIISGNKKYISVKNALINPTTVALVIALPLFFLGVSLDERFAELASAFRMLGDMTTPLSMIIIGIKLAEMPFKQVFSSPFAYISSFIKLLISPVLVFLAVSLIPGISRLALFVLVIITAMPTATVTVANAERFGGDSHAAAQAMLCSTLLSVFTIPLVCLLL